MPPAPYDRKRPRRRSPPSCSPRRRAPARPCRGLPSAPRRAVAPPAQGARRRAKRERQKQDLEQELGKGQEQELEKEQVGWVRPMRSPPPPEREPSFRRVRSRPLWSRPPAVSRLRSVMCSERTTPRRSRPAPGPARPPARTEAGSVSPLPPRPRSSSTRSDRRLSLIHISEPTRQAEISY